MEEIVKHINDTNASYRPLGAGDAKNTDLFLDNEHYQLFEGAGEHITVRFHKENLAKAILFIASILPRKFDQSSVHCVVPYSKDFVINQLALLDALFVEDGKQVNTITQVWNARKDVPQKNGKIDTRFYFNGLLKDVLYMDSTGKDQKDKFTIRNYFAGGYSELHIRKAEDNIFDVRIENASAYHDDGKEKRYEEAYVAQKDYLSLQQIYYGAPGTGKSHTIKEQTKGKDVVRTTFHPDTDYSTFVGAYKPTTKSFPVTTVIGTKAVAVEDKDGKGMTEDKIVYEFVPQAFLQAYVAAWEKFDKEEDLSKPEEEFLVIEEINRGNCAQIFGDLFQLLDRGNGGFSEYPIKADADMKKYLQKALKDVNLDGIANSINAMFNGEDMAKQVKNGDILLLPCNLYIWATMNTSDQSLFPIDSAFKRRWDWQYVPISDAGKQWVVRVNGNDYSWWHFLEEINKRIYKATYSEDKKLGYFFCKADNDGVIDADKFVSKVVFYLWNDVFKDMEFEDDAFKDGENGKLLFDEFYKVEAGKTKVVSDKVELFLTNLELAPVAASPEDDSEEYAGQQETGESSEKDQSTWSATELKRYEFWEAFLTYGQQNAEFSKYFDGVKKASKNHWKNFFIPGVDFYLCALQQRKKNAAEVQVYFGETNDVYHRLYSHKAEIEQEMGVTYNWKELPEKKSSIISESKFNVDFENKDSWGSIFDFFIDRLLRMRTVFAKYAKE